jgi:hypothetical protein
VSRNLSQFLRYRLAAKLGNRHLDHYCNALERVARMKLLQKPFANCICHWSCLLISDGLHIGTGSFTGQADTLIQT